MRDCAIAGIREGWCSAPTESTLLERVDLNFELPNGTRCLM